MTLAVTQKNRKWLAQRDRDRAKPGTAGKDSTTGKRYVVYDNEVRVGGTRPWRNNNPGGLTKHPKFKNGSIGDDGKFWIYPNPKTGMQALREEFQEYLKKMTIRSAITAHAPPNENPTEEYIKHVVEHINRKKTKSDVEGDVKDTTPIKNLKSPQMEALLEGITIEEGWTNVSVPKRTYTCAKDTPQRFRTLLGCK
ncbi:MAG: hypothetical protein IMF11_12715 [Proteobacteria bacterium]|nr:hypothetical protein [Pseudomonadota bacterium]